MGHVPGVRGELQRVLQKTAALNPLERRYGIASSSQYRWYTTDTRFDVDIEPNEPNRFGWVVEIDPFDPNSTPVKHTGLGRLKHEGAWVEEADDGKVVVYLGDDQANEYIYRYVSDRPWQDRSTTASRRSTTGSCTSPGSTPTGRASGCR